MRKGTEGRVVVAPGMNICFAESSHDPLDGVFGRKHDGNVSVIAVTAGLDFLKAQSTVSLKHLSVESSLPTPALQ